MPFATPTAAPQGCDEDLDPHWPSLLTYGTKTGCRLERYKWVKHSTQHRITLKPP